MIIIFKNCFLVLFENYKSRSILGLKQPTHNKTKSKYQIGLRADNRKEERSTCGTHSGEEGRKGSLLSGSAGCPLCGQAIHRLIRKQFVKLNNQTNCLRDVNIGVPQGWVFGPILLTVLLICYKRLSKCSTNVWLYRLLFADDTNIFS